MPIDFDAMRRDMGLEEEQPTLSEVIKATPDYNPDTHGSDLTMGKKLGLPPDVVGANREQARIDSQFVDTPDSHIKNTAPAFYQRLMADPDFAVLAKDEIERIRAASENATTWAERWHKRAGGTMMQMAGGFVQMLGERRKELHTQIKEAGGEDAAKARADLGLGEAEFDESSIEAGQDMFNWGQRQVQKYAENAEPGSLNETLTDVADALPLFITMLGAGVVGGGPAAMAAMSPIMGQAYGESRQKGRTPQEAGLDSLAQFAMEYGPERIPLKIFLGGKAGGSLLKRFTQGTLAEGATESLTEILQSAYDAGVIEEDGTIQDAIAVLGEQETWQQAWRAFKAGAVLGGGAAVATHPIDPEVARAKAQGFLEQGIRKAREADNFQDGLKSLGQAVQETKLFGRNREMLGDLIAESAQNNEVYLDSEGLKVVYAQLGQKEGDQLIDQLGVKAQLDEAGELGGDLTVSLNGIVNVADNPAFDAIIGHMKADPFASTPIQAAQEVEQQQADFDALAEQILAQSAPDSKRAADAEVIRQKTEADLLKAGFSAEDAYAKSLLQRNIAVVMSDWTGLPVAEAYGELRTRRSKGAPVQRTAPPAAQRPEAPVASEVASDRRQETAEVENDQRQGERRTDVERRERVAAMTTEEQVNLLYSHELTGLNNRRAFEEDLGQYPFVASLDADSLKTVNDNISPAAGDAMLQEIAQVLDEVLPDQAYHISGDEYYVLGNDPHAIKAGLDEAVELLKERGVSDKKGSLSGLSFSYGIAETKDEADLAMKQHKRDREATGERAGRGEIPRGMTLNKSLGQSASIRRGNETLENYGLETGKKYLTREVAMALEARQAAKYGKIALNDRSADAEAKIAKWIAEEIKFEMQHPEDSGLGWYSEKWGQTIDLFSNQFPELATDQNARDAFTMLMAITSDGQKVSANFTLASKAYAGYRETGRLDAAEMTSNRAIAGHVEKVNALIDQFNGDIPKMKAYLLEEMTVKELRADARKNKTTFKADYTGEVVLPRAAGIFGEKLGAFYANLAGSHGYLTMDRWWSRTFNRYRGNTVTSATRSSLDTLARQMAENGFDPFESYSDTDLALAARSFARMYGAQNWNTPLELMVGRKRPTTKKGQADWDADAKSLAGDQYKTLLSQHQLWKTANTVHKSANVELRDVPENSSDRAFMIRTVQRAQKNLKRSGTDMSIADIQAVLWYYEKRLYGELGARQSADISYVEAARQWLDNNEIPIRLTTPGPDGQGFDHDLGINLEIAPDPNQLAATQAFEGLTTKNKVAATQEVAEAIIPQVTAAMGLPTVSFELTNGGYLDQVNPSLILRHPGLSRQDLVDLGRVLGDIFSQDSVAVYDESNTDPETAVTHVRLEPSRALSEAEQRQLYDHLREQAIGVGGYTWRSGAMVLGDYEGVGAEFKPAITAALAELDIDVDIKVSEKAFFADLEMINHGESDRRGIETGRDVARRRGGGTGEYVDSLRQESQAILSSHLETTFGQTVPAVRPTPESLLPGGLKTNARGLVPLTHWGNTEGLEVLDPAAAGTGVDSLRRRSNPDAPRHVYFGAPGYVIEGGVAAGAKARYYSEVDPRSLYNFSGDPDGLYDQVKEMNPGAYQYQIDELYLQAIRNAGYQGHWFNQGNNGAVVAMYEPVPVKQAKSTQTAHRARNGWIAGFDIKGNEFEASFEQERRGQITLGRDSSTIELFEQADMSTFLHESAHFFLHRMMIFSQTSPRVQQEMDKVLAWMGVNHVSEIQEEHHEMFAEGFERYLAEGKAPTPELRPVMQRFRDWIVGVYRDLIDSELQVTISDDIRSVFDQLMIADGGYTEVAQELNSEPLLLDPIESGMTPSEHRAYVRAVQEAREISRAKLDKQVLEDEMRARSSEFKARVATLADEIADDLKDTQPYIARKFLQTGEGLEFDPFKLNLAEVKQYPAEIVDRLPKGKKSVTSGDGMPLDEAADLLGYQSGEKLLMDLADHQDLMVEANARARQQAKSELGFSPKNEAELQDAAVQAIMSRSKADTLYMELRALDRLAGGKGVPRKVLKRTAQRMVAEMKVSDLKPGKYLAATIRHAKAAERFTKTKNWERASQEKRAQLLNHQMYMQVRDARTGVESARRYFRKFKKKSIYKRVDPSYVDQIHTILEAFEFKKTTEKERANRKGLAKFVQEKVNAGEAVLVDPDIIAAASRTAVEDLTVSRLRDIQDWVKNLEHLGALKSKLFGLAQARDFAAVKKEVIQSLEENNNLSDVLPDRRKDLLATARRNTSSFFAGLLNMEFVAMKLDGDKRGTITNLLWEPINRAQDILAVRKDEAGQEIGKLNARYGITPRGLHKRIYVEAVDETLTKEEILAIALNWGNQGNRDRLLSIGHSNKHAGKWSEQEYNAILDKLTKEEWHWVQGVWDHIDGYWPEIAQLEKELTGLPPEKVEALEVRTKYGKLRGGYYPIVYDADLSERANQFEESVNVREIFGGNWARAQTRHGHTEKRIQEVQRALKLDLGVIDHHISNVLLDLTHRKPVMDTYKLFQDPEVAMVFKQAAGTEVYRQINPWLQWVSGSYRASNYRTGLERFVRRLRVGASVVGIGFRLSTALINFTGIFPALTEIRNPALIFKHMGRITANPKKAWQFITERSDMMKMRSKVFDREAAEQLSSPDMSTLGVPIALWYSLIAKVDQVVTMTTWHAAYDQEMKRTNNNDAAATVYADSVVRTTQSSARAADLSAVQRPTNELLKLVTIFYSYFNMIYNRSHVAGRKLKKGDVFGGIGDLVAIWFLPTLIGEWLVGRWPGDDEDESVEMGAAKALLTYGAGTVPLVRDVASAMVNGYGYQLSPVQGFGANAVKAIEKSLADESEPIDILKPAIAAAGYVAHLPAGQINKTLEYMLEDQPDRDLHEHVWYALVGKKPEE